MSTLTIEVQSQIFGAGQDNKHLEAVRFVLPSKRITVAELIHRAVEEQVKVLLFKHKLEKQEISHILNRQYLTNQEITEARSQGKVRYPSNSYDQEKFNIVTHIHKALRAFELGKYIILVNGYQAQNLNEELNFEMDTEIIFLRLLPLAGG